MQSRSSQPGVPAVRTVRDGAEPEAIAITESETYQTLLARAHRRTGGVPPERIVRNVLSVTHGGDWPVQRDALDAVLRRCASTRTDEIQIVQRPTGRLLGLYATRRRGSPAHSYRTLLRRIELPDGDGVMNEMTRADVTAVTMFEATLPVPGRVIPNHPDVERAVSTGERVFDEIRCTTCHVPALPLDKKGWIYSEPGPYNPSGNLRRAGARVLEVDLTNPSLPQPRLAPSHEDPTVLSVPAYTDFKLHDITDSTDDDAKEPLDANQPLQSPRFAAGNRKFLTRRLWGAANEPPYFHHGLFSTMRQAVLAHHGEAAASRSAFVGATEYDQDSLIEFLKSLQVLPPGTKALIVDELYRPKAWRTSKPTGLNQSQRSTLD